MVIGEVIQYIANSPGLLVAGFLLYIFIFALSLVFSGPKPYGRNPFSASCVKPPEPTVHDQKLRDKVLKSRFKPDRVPREPDVIIIGSGPGGLSTAVLLAKAGKTVLVLEQHDQAGGTSHTFYEHGFEFDTGIHYLGEMSNSQFRTLIDQLTNGQLVWERMDEEFDIVAMAQNSKVHFYPRKAGKEAYMADLIDKFPKERDGIEKFFKLLSECRNAFTAFGFLKVAPKWLARLMLNTGIFYLMYPAYQKYSSITLQQVLDDVTSSKELQLILSYIFGDYDNEQMQLFRDVFLAHGKGRRRTLPSLQMKVKKQTILQLALLREEASKSWDDVSSWMTSLCPHYPAGMARYRIQSTITEAETRRDDFDAFLMEVCDLDCIGVQPEKTPFLLHAGVMNHYMKGAYYPRGGTSEITFQMIQVIEKYGGRVLVKAPVSQILMNSKGRAHGVRVQKENSHVDLFAKTIVSDAGVLNTFTKLLPNEVGSKSCLYRALKKVGESISYITVFVGLKGSKDDLGLKANNTWAFYSMDMNESMREMESMKAEEVVDKGLPVLFICFPSAKHSTWHEKSPDKSMALVIGPANFKWFEKWDKEKVKHRGDDYEDLKNRIGRQMWEQALKVYPHLEDKEAYFEVGSPVSNKYYLGGQRGEMYGLDHSRRFLPDVAVDLRPKTDVPGLFITGQDVMTCGLSPSLFSGVFCASAILHRKLYSDLQTLYKTMKKNC